jgi:deoxyhypusine synthase
MAAMMTSGFQATALGQAVEEVNRMVRSSRALQHYVCAVMPASVAVHDKQQQQQKRQCICESADCHRSSSCACAAVLMSALTGVLLLLLLLLPLLWCYRQINWRLEDDPITDNTAPEHQDPAFRASCRTKIYLGYTSNLISAGVREQIRCAQPQQLLLQQHEMAKELSSGSRVVIAVLLQLR